jgi:hypothetical protein
MPGDGLRLVPFASTVKNQLDFFSLRGHHKLCREIVYRELYWPPCFENYFLKIKSLTDFFSEYDKLRSFTKPIWSEYIFARGIK